MRPSLINRHGEIGNAINRSLVNSIVSFPETYQPRYIVFLSRKFRRAWSSFDPFSNILTDFRTSLFHFRTILFQFQTFWNPFLFIFEHFWSIFENFWSIFEHFWSIFEQFCFNSGHFNHFLKVFESFLNMSTLLLSKIEHIWWKLMKIFMNILRYDF